MEERSSLIPLQHDEITREEEQAKFEKLVKKEKSGSKEKKEKQEKKQKKEKKEKKSKKDKRKRHDSDDEGNDEINSNKNIESSDDLKSSLRTVANVSKSSFFESLMQSESRKMPIGTVHSLGKKLKDESKIDSGDWLCDKCSFKNQKYSNQCGKCKAMKRMTTYR